MRTVSEVAALTGVTVRTLHHYDDIGLVRPAHRSEAGYRLYDEQALERLHLVLFYRELGFALTEIRRLLDADDFDRGRALRHQRDMLGAEAQRLGHVIRAVDRAIAAHEEGEELSEDVMFEVFRSGAPADTEAAMDAVEAHRVQISERFYPCSHAMQVQLAEGYVTDPRFTATYQAIEPGLAVWVRDAVRANAQRATG